MPLPTIIGIPFSSKTEPTQRLWYYSESKRSQLGNRVLILMVIFLTRLERLKISYEEKSKFTSVKVPLIETRDQRFFLWS